MSVGREGSRGAALGSSPIVEGGRSTPFKKQLTSAEPEAASSRSSVGSDRKFHPAAVAAAAASCSAGLRGGGGGGRGRLAIQLPAPAKNEPPPTIAHNTARNAPGGANQEAQHLVLHGVWRGVGAGSRGG